MNDKPENKRRPALRWAAYFIIVALIAGGTLALYHPASPLPNAWNPTRPLQITDPVTPLTGWKLQRTLADPALCRATLAQVSDATALSPIETPANCQVPNRVQIRQLGSARIDAIDTSCAVALRLALWQRHGLQPAARAILGADITQIRQIGSYNCRAMRLSNGTTGRMSSHATADAIDITGFDLSDGRNLRLTTDWSGDTPEGRFLRVARDTSCDWFRVTLSPDYNALHANHFHLQSTGWGLCR